MTALVPLAGPSVGVTPYVYHQGRIQLYEDVGFTAGTQGLHYGTGVFEGIRAYWQPETAQLHVVRLAEHYRRFLASAGMLRLEIAESVDELCAATAELLVRNDYRGDCYLRPIAHKLALLPGASFGVKLSGLSTALSVYAVPMPRAPLSRSARAQVSSWRRIPDTALPAHGKITGSYANVALAVDEAESNGYDEAILLNVRGTVAEAGTANVFLVRDGHLITPHEGSDILAGITRRCVLEMAVRLGDRTVEREVARSELYTADEVFLTGTGCELLPVTEVDGRVVGDGRIGPVTARYAESYRAAVTGQASEYAPWSTTVQLNDPAN
ncbi:branched-chain amino acid transaminase [Amycolatopsis azurea]|uniref:Branched-chain-amino-acid aminotransferase n=1 Tax=Amycolatopsis azurea DSM 43854 TaxID=1238180 RepID=M2PF89_9PSEU|nr:branched-chain amino acid transaminase [Amycolatopsis azurea]EMD23013.1 Branched-chain amino acid aminotransferase [Amycolatopsis azurea DSM 43854]OOC08135.1 branched-chain amino acid aminotransferase [Amycolatopsis azurea DSM 43854]